MRLRFLIPSGLAAFCFLAGLLPAAAMASDEGELANSAFYAANHGNWSNAIAYAHEAGDPILLKLITWEYALDNNSGADFDDIAQFIRDNPGWPDQKTLHIRAEQALRNSHVSDQEVIDWFGDDTPITGIGKVALAEALKRTHSGDMKKIVSLIRAAWKDGDFDEAQEKSLLASYGSYFRQQDHIDRIDRLLWEEKITPAKRLLSRVPPSYRKLFKARMDLIADKRISTLAVALVPGSLKNDPGLIYDRMRYRARRGDDAGVRQMLLSAPENVPYPEKWWNQRELQVRTAIGEKKYSMAQKLLARHGQVDGTELAAAVWLEGWLKCEFLKRPKEAARIFRDMFDQMHYSVSKARAAYWTARAEERSGDKDAAEKWYTIATGYPTTFYGQLASLKLSGTKPLRIPSPPAISDDARDKIEGSDIARAIKICIAQNEMRLARRLIGWMTEHAESDAELVLIASLGHDTGNDNLAVHAAKKAMQQNVVLIGDAYPTTKTPRNPPVERALTLAITRQESEFDPKARSGANAMGLMQLIPRTAKEIAKKLGMHFSHERLYDPEYNVTLGSAYLGRLIDGYDGSYILAIAAYNAGPGNVRSWVNDFGAPGGTVDGAVDWIEEIPFAETRNYVQRVLENLQIYRHIEAGDNDAPLELGKDLVR